MLVLQILDVFLEVNDAVVDLAFNLLDAAVLAEIVNLIPVPAVDLPVVLSQLIYRLVELFVVAALKLAFELLRSVMLAHVFDMLRVFGRPLALLNFESFVCHANEFSFMQPLELFFDKFTVFIMRYELSCAL